MLSRPRKHCVGPSWSAFGGVIEDHVENDFDSGAVQRFDHVAKLVNGPERILTRAIRLVRRKERNGRIAPIVHPSRRRILSIELKYREQFDCCDAQLLEDTESSRSDPAYVPRFDSATPELGCAVKPRTCIS